MRSKKYFNCSDRERAVFEAGIKLASLYHQYIGSPLNKEKVDHFEKAMEDGMKVQPYVEDAEVKIDRSVLEGSISHFGYGSLNERMLIAKVRISYEGIKVTASMGWIEELHYPLMRIDSIEEE